MKKKIGIGLVLLLLGVAACTPVFAIGWREVFIVVVIAVFLLGPPVYRFIRRLESSRRKKEE